MSTQWGRKQKRLIRKQDTLNNKGWGTPMTEGGCPFGGNSLQKPAYPNCWTEAPQNIEESRSPTDAQEELSSWAQRCSHCCIGREKFLKNKTRVRKNGKRFMLLFYNNTLRHVNCVSRTVASWPLASCLFLSWVSQSNFRCSHNHFYSGPHLPPPKKCCILYLKNFKNKS